MGINNLSILSVYINSEKAGKRESGEEKNSGEEGKRVSDKVGKQERGKCAFSITYPLTNLPAYPPLKVS